MSATVNATLTLGAITAAPDAKSIAVAGMLSDTNWVEVWKAGKRVTPRQAVQTQGPWTAVVSVPGAGSYELRVFSAASGGTAIIRQAFTVAQPTAEPPPPPPPPSGTTVGSVTIEAATDIPAGVATFAYVFAPGDVPQGQAVTGAQGDIKTRWPDGSAKMALIAALRPALAARTSWPVPLSAGAPSSAAPVDLAAVLAQAAPRVKLAFADGTTFETAVTATTDFWRRGNLVTEARFTAMVPNSSMRVVVDAAAYAGGGLSLDVQFANDRAMEAVGGKVAYAATITASTGELLRETIAEQHQYSVWRRRVVWRGADGGQGVRGLNVRHDTARLEAMYIVPPVERALAPAIDWNRVDSWLAAPDWGRPLAANNVVKAMPMAGGRGDIGPTTQGSALWLMTGDPRAAAYALGQAEASGACTWNMWDAAGGTWLNCGRYPHIWVDARGGTGRPGDTTSTGLTQQVYWSSDSWQPERAHQPNLSFVPYILTGERWLLDRVLAVAAWNTVATWPGNEFQGEGYNTVTGARDLVVRSYETRGRAWAMREIEGAALAAPDGSAEKGFFRHIADENWKWLVAQLPAWSEMTGEAHGFVPAGARLAPWQEAYFSFISGLAAGRGQADARRFLEWQQNFLVGRFERDDFPVKDGLVYVIQVGAQDAGGWLLAYYKTWREIAADTYARGMSNTDPINAPTGWERTGGNYANLALASLRVCAKVLNSDRAKAAHAKVVALNPPYCDANSRAGEPQFCSML